MGSNWGIIHNQSKEEIVYILHHSELTATKIQKKIGANIGANMTTEVSGSLNGHYAQEIKQVNCNSIYKVSPQSMTTVGLLKVDFDKIKFITIATSNGKYLIESGKVSNGQHLRIRINSDLSYKYIDRIEAESLKLLEKEATVQSGKCPLCRCQAKLKQSPFNQCIRCRVKKESEKIWVCQNLPLRHFLCGDCYQTENKASLLQSLNL